MHIIRLSTSGSERQMVKQDEVSSPPGQSARPDFAQILLVALVAIRLVLPATIEIAGWGKPVSENRTLAEAPGWPANLAEYRTFPQRLTAFVNDHFGLRSQLVRWNSELRLKLGTSSSPSVAVGRDGFLFYAYHDERLLEQHTGEEIFTSGDTRTVGKVGGGGKGLAKAKRHCFLHTHRSGQKHHLPRTASGLSTPA